ncbi:hypothetical protein [Lysobacter gummosus]|uniref:hypothetical protein n=1 Tax=Lysobacter gummosus TaxID=262324 RepID=UPI00363C702F
MNRPTIRYAARSPCANTSTPSSGAFERAGDTAGFAQRRRRRSPRHRNRRPPAAAEIAFRPRCPRAGKSVSSVKCPGPHGTLV